MLAPPRHFSSWLALTQLLLAPGGAFHLLQRARLLSSQLPPEPRLQRVRRYVFLPDSSESEIALAVESFGLHERRGKRDADGLLFAVFGRDKASLEASRRALHDPDYAVVERPGLLSSAETRLIREYADAHRFSPSAVGDDVVVLNDVTGARNELVRACPKREPIGIAHRHTTPRVHLSTPPPFPITRIISSPNARSKRSTSSRVCSTLARMATRSSWRQCWCGGTQGGIARAFSSTLTTTRLL